MYLSIAWEHRFLRCSLFCDFATSHAILGARLLRTENAKKCELKTLTYTKRCRFGKILPKWLYSKQVIAKTAIVAIHIKNYN